jgi:hypothetical protein
MGTSTDAREEIRFYVEGASRGRPYCDELVRPASMYRWGDEHRVRQEERCTRTTGHDGEHSAGAQWLGFVRIRPNGAGVEITVDRPNGTGWGSCSIRSRADVLALAQTIRDAADEYFPED